VFSATADLDLALILRGLSHGPAVAQSGQLALEYDPNPQQRRPPGETPAEIGELVSSYYAQRCS
jgi:hypothetical protein